MSLPTVPRHELAALHIRAINRTRKALGSLLGPSPLADLSLASGGTVSRSFHGANNAA